MTEFIIPDLPPVTPSGKGPGSETVTVIRAPKKDRLKPAEGEETRHDIKDCVVLPRAGRDDQGGWVQLVGFNVFAAPGADIKPDDTVLCRGQTLAVIGEPGLLRNKRGKAKVLTVTLGALIRGSS